MSTPARPKGWILILGGIMAMLLPAAPLPAYKLFTTDVASPVRERQWQTPGNVPFRASTQRPTNLTQEEVVTTIQNSYATWTAVSNSAFNYVYQGTTASGFNLGDGVNVATVQSSGTWVGGSGVLGFAQSRVTTNGPSQGFIVESDVVVNGLDFNWSTNGQTVGGATTFDLQSTVIHEAGHSLGLDHTPLNGATMYFSSTNIGQGGTTGTRRRVLSLDDQTGLRVLYGNAAGTATITGTITTPSGNPGHVVGVVNVATGDTVVAFTGTRVDLPNQQYRIERLPAGDYLVFTRPLDNDTLTTGVGDFRGGASFDTNFRARLFRSGQAGGTTDVAQASVVSVAANGTATASITPPVGVGSEALLAAANLGGNFAPGGAYVSVNPSTIDLVYQSAALVNGARTPVLIGGGGTMTPLHFGGLSFSDGRRIYRSTITLQRATLGSVRSVAVPYANGAEITIASGIVEMGLDVSIPDPVIIDSNHWALFQ